MNKHEGVDDTFKPQREDHTYNPEPQREDSLPYDGKEQRDDTLPDDGKEQRNDTLPDDGREQRNDTLPDDGESQKDDNPVVTVTPPKPVANDIFDENGFYRIANTTANRNSSSSSQTVTPPKPVANDIFDDDGFYRIVNTTANRNSSSSSQPVTPPKPVANDIFDDNGFYRIVNTTANRNSSSSSQPATPVKPPVSNQKPVTPPQKSNNKGKIILVLFVLATILTAVFLLKQYNTVDLPLISDPTTTATTDAPVVEDTTEHTDDEVFVENPTETAEEVFVEEETEYTVAAEVFVGYNTVDFDSYGTKRYYFDSPESGYYEFKSDNNEDLKVTLCVDGGLVLEDDDSGEDRNFVVVAYLDRDSFADLDISPVSSDTYVSELNLEISKVTETYATGFELFKFYKENGLYMTSDDATYLSPSYSSEDMFWTNAKLFYPKKFLISGNTLWLAFSATNEKYGDYYAWYPIELTEKYLTGYEIFLHYKYSGLYMTKDDTIYLDPPSYSSDGREWTNEKIYYPTSFLISQNVLWLSFEATNDELGDHNVWYPIKLTDKYISGYEKFLDYKNNGIYMTRDDTIYLDPPSYSSDTREWTNEKTYYPTSFLISQNVLWLSFEATNDELGDHSVWYPVKLS